MSQRIDRDRLVELRTLDGASEQARMVRSLPGLAAGLDQQRRIAGATISGFEQAGSEPRRDRHRPPKDLLLTATFPRARHHQSRVITITLHISDFEPCELADARSRHRCDLDE